MKKVQKTGIGLIRLGRLAKFLGFGILGLLLFPNALHAEKSFTGNESGNIYMHPLGETNKAAIIITGVDQNKFTFTVEDYAGDVLYHTKTVRNANSYSQAFDFSRLEDGEYIVKLRFRNGTKERKFKLKDGVVSIYYPEKVRPEFNALRQKGFLLIPNYYQEVFTIRVISSNGDVLHKSSTSDLKIRKNFNFEHAPKGVYQIALTSPSHETSFSFNNQVQ